MTCPRAFRKLMAKQSIESKTLILIVNYRPCFTYLLDHNAIVKFLSWEELSLDC